MSTGFPPTNGSRRQGSRFKRRLMRKPMVLALLLAGSLAVVPAPNAVRGTACAGFSLQRALRVPRETDRGALELLNERWRALGILPAVGSSAPQVTFIRTALPSQGYRLSISSQGISIASTDSDGAFYAMTTLAQLANRSGGRWQLPCVEITDSPALRWRILSDDVSRGPLPTMRYFKERIRTIAAFKMNGYSPYMEHVFADPHHPLPAPPDGITPTQLTELARYAARFHVQFIPEQQTFAHMHNTLRFEQYAPAAELPHGYLMSPLSTLTQPYLKTVIGDELAAVPHPAFFHIGSDEPSDLGRGQTKPAVDAYGTAAVYAEHINRMAQMIAPSHARVMVWDDAIQAKPEILDHLPKSAVIINWHYGAEKTFEPYIATIASHGFDQMVAPGANNWNEVFPDLAGALPNESRFINQGKAAHVLGLFQTVWHDDGETLYEATWFPVLFAAAQAWETGDVQVTRFANDFPHAFFGSDDARFGTDALALGDVVHGLEAGRNDTTDYLFWSDPLNAQIAARMHALPLSDLRVKAEGVLAHLLGARPPLHQNAARVMALAARRLDYLARDFQIGQEARYYYDDAKSHAGDASKGLVYRGLFIAKYNFWELRDNMEELAPLYAAAWDYENRPGHRASTLERYHLAAARAITRADAINTMTYEDFLRGGRFPTFDQVMGLSAP